MTYEARFKVAGSGWVTTTLDARRSSHVKAALRQQYGADVDIFSVRQQTAKPIETVIVNKVTLNIPEPKPEPKHSNLMPFLAGAAVGALAAKALAPQPTILIPEPSYDERIRLERAEKQAGADHIERLNQKAREENERDAERERQRWNALTLEEQGAELLERHHNQQTQDQRVQIHQLATKIFEQNIDAHLDFSQHIPRPEWADAEWQTTEWSEDVLIPAEELVFIVEEVRADVREKQERQATEIAKENAKALAEALAKEEAAAHPFRAAWINLVGEEDYRRDCFILPIAGGIFAVGMLILGIACLFGFH